MSGDPTPTLTWYLGSILLPNPTLPRFSLGANNSLIVADISQSDEGLVLLCQASNIAGTESATLTIDVNSKFVYIIIINNVCLIMAREMNQFLNLGSYLSWRSFFS